MPFRQCSKPQAVLSGWAGALGLQQGVLLLCNP